MGNLYIDVTNTTDSKFISGIQRVVCEFGAALSSREETVYLKRLQGTGKYEIWTGDDFRDFCREKKNPAGNRRTITLDELRESDTFFDMDAVWNNFEERRNEVYQKLKRNHVRIITMIYDVLPVTHPHFFSEDTMIQFLIYFSAVLCYSDVILVNAEATKNEIERITLEAGLPEKEIRVVPLGADFSSNDQRSEKPEIREEVRAAAERPFLFMMGTIEPRKNHQLVLDAYEQGLRDLPVNLVIAGRKGWHVDNLMGRIEGHRDLNRRIFFVERPSDQEVRYLYQHAWGVVFASHGEGFGLPVIEALHYGKLVFASRIDVLREIGGDSLIYFDQHDPLSLADKVSEMISSPELEKEQRERIGRFHIESWKEASDELISVLDEVTREIPADRPGNAECPETALSPRQAYILTARPEEILETLPFYEHWMPFVREAVIGCPEQCVKRIREEYHGGIQLRFITDESLLKENLPSGDRQARIFRLRVMTILRGELDDVFIMADDDSRPLRKVDAGFFIRDGRFRLYSCGEMKKNRGMTARTTADARKTENTADLLSSANLPMRRYSSHSPQIICGRLFREALNSFHPEKIRTADEWSLYGNYAAAHYAMFVESVPCRTMNLPVCPDESETTAQPQEYVFENLNRDLYAAGKPFEGFSTGWNDGIAEENIRKVQISLRQQYEYAAGEKAADMCGSLFRRIYGHPPVWRVDLDHGRISVPEVLLTPRGHAGKIPVCIVNHDAKVRKIRFKGVFEENRTGQIHPFLDEEWDTERMNGVHDLRYHFPDVDAEGIVRFSIETDGEKTVSTSLSVIAI